MVHTTTSRTGRRNIFGRRRVVHHQKRHASIGDKISGALMRLKGSLTRRPGQKVRSTPDGPYLYYSRLTMNPQAAGTRRMHGTDGRGSHRRGHML